MNERIKELAKEAGYYLYDLTETHECKTVETDSKDEWITLEKFAKLIVRECGQTLVDNTPLLDLIEDWDNGYDRAMNDCIHHIYEHFGVTEE